MNTLEILVILNIETKIGNKFVLNITGFAWKIIASSMYVSAFGI